MTDLKPAVEFAKKFAGRDAFGHPIATEDKEVESGSPQPSETPRTDEGCQGFTAEEYDAIQEKWDEEATQRYHAENPDISSQTSSTIAKSDEHKLWTCSDFEKIEKPEGLDLLGQGIIRRGQLTLLMGQGGLGKSTFSFALAVAAVRRENHFAGIPLHSPFNSLFFNAEASPWRFKEDFRAAKEGTSPELHADLDNRIHIAPMFDQGSCDHSDLKAFAVRIKAYVAKVMPDLVVFDPWSEFAIDEMDTKSVRESLRQLKTAVWTANPQAAIVFVVHAKPGMEAAAAGASNFGGGSNQRGNRAVFNSARAALSMAPFSDQGTDFVLSLSKANDAPQLAPRRLSLDRQTLTYRVDSSFEADEWRAELRKNRPVAKISVEEVIAVIESAEVGMRTPKDIVAALLKLPSGPSKRTADRAIKAAKDTGRVTKERGQLVVNATHDSDTE